MALDFCANISAAAPEVEGPAYGRVEALGNARHAPEVEGPAYLLLACCLGFC